MKTNRPGFRSYLKCIFKNETEITNSDGEKYIFKDTKPRTIIICVNLAITFMLLLFNYAEIYTRSILAASVLVVLFMVYIPLVFLLTKFTRISRKDGEDNHGE